MTGKRRKARLSAEDEQIWRYAMRNVKPLHGGPKTGSGGTAQPRPPLKPARPAFAVPNQPAAPPVRHEPLNGPANRQWARRMGRGDMAIDARIDLHGLSQAAAHARLMRFLAHAQARDLRVLLVITGKGGQGKADGERGVLRRVMPQWIRESAAGSHVLSISSAHPRHGGTGAYYVVLRRRRG